ncbi:pentatricopeptide repeat protein [Rhodotorula toruloides NP11]|uniref:Pentatricopeptide repeat protein n=1 Tax=Rhodotorula toruloides (strain NP11) TaxID=1130832 RepID=M7X9A6_RHOT1|nr:pentatricopeptide repeat protein [Rhodotorula toruloides NP11]EMS20259.1 pentatricopeptide repeat protein [Rhodotorula toruloides NP11]
MVVNLSYKLTHLAHSLRHGGHSLRNAFPSTANPGFDFTSNVFGTVSNAAGNVGGGAATTLGVAAGALGAGAGAAAGASSGGATGGAGGASSKAGSWGANWGFQNGKPTNGQAAQADSQQLNDDADDLRALASSPARRRALLRSRTAQSSGRIASSFRARHGSLSSGSAPHPDLLRAEEAGLSGVRLSSVEMQRRYHSAFARGEKADEAVEREADEVDLDVSTNTDVLRSRRRASISNRPTMTLASPFVITTTPFASPRRPSTPLSSATRSIHTSAVAAETAPPTDATTATESAAPPPPASSDEAAPTPNAFSEPPPTGTVGRARSNSSPTSDRPSLSRTLSRERAPSDGDSQWQPTFAPASPRFLAKREARGLKRADRQADANEPSEIAKDRDRNGWLVKRRQKEGLTVPGAEATLDLILAASKTGQVAVLEHAVQQYRADAGKWSSAGHKEAMNALLHLRRPNDPIDPIIRLYNDLFDHEQLHPSRRAYEVVIEAFCVRDKEIVSQIEALEAKAARRTLTVEARGPWKVAENAQDVLGEQERETLARLRDTNFYQHALVFFNKLGEPAKHLSLPAYEALIETAAARGDVETAVSLFGRVEQQKYQNPGWRSHSALIKLHAKQENGADLVKEIFESYLLNRSKGVIRNSGLESLRRTNPADSLDAKVSGDEQVWNETIRSLVSLGDFAGAVAIVEKLIVALNSTEPAPQGYPDKIGPEAWGSLAAGFAAQGEHEKAVTWFDRLVSGEAQGLRDGTNKLPGFALLDGMRTDDVAFVNHVYRYMLAQADKVPLSIAHLARVVDYNLAHAAKTEDPDARNALFDTVIEFRRGFEQAVLANHVEAGGAVSFSDSTGLLGRMAATMGSFGRFDVATSTFVELANIVRRLMRDAGDEDVADAQNEAGWTRSRRTWALTVTDDASGALGFVPAINSDSAIHGLTRLVAERPSLQQAVTVVGWTNKLRNVVHLAPVANHVLAVAEAYSAARAGPERDAELSQLSGDNWYTVLEGMAYSAALLQRGVAVDFSFAGFDAAFDDFLASGSQLPLTPETAELRAIRDSLALIGAPEARIDEVVNALQQKTAQTMQQQPSSTDADAAAAKVDVVEDEAGSVTSESLGTATSATQETASATNSVLTPPSTPPAYFAEREIKPAASSAPAANEPAVDLRLTQLLDAFIGGHNIDKAFAKAREAAQQGRYARPETYSRLIELLGRNKRMDEARIAYLDGYAALKALDNDPTAQALAWVQLEDRMILALANAGELKDVGHHRDRLIRAGVAPSADAYGAMIANMHETTDNASIALTLFEEAIGLGVRPSQYLFNTLLSKLSKARRAKEVLDYFELMKEYGVRPSAITYGTVISACCKIGDDATATFLFNEMVAMPGFEPRVPPYNCMIQFYTQTKPDRERALHYWDRLRNDRVLPTAFTYKCLLDAYGSIAPPDLEQTQQVFAQLVRDRGVTVNGSHWASLITAYGIFAKDLDRAQAIFDSISHHPSTRRNPNGRLPDAVVYEALLNACIANDRHELVDQYLERMRAEGVRMTAYVANALIKAYAERGAFQRARNVFAAMADPPAGVASVGNHPNDRQQRNSRLASNAHASVDEPTYREPSTYETMIRCELAAKEPSKALEVYARAQQRAFPPAIMARLHKLLASEGVELQVQQSA